MKTTKMLAVLLSLLVSSILIQLPELNFAEEKYPTKAIKFIVPYAAGSKTDVICRKVVSIAKESLGQEIIVESKEGAAGLVAARFLAKSKPDGYTMGALPSSPFAISPNFAKIDLDPLTDVVPIIQIITNNQVLAVPFNSPIKTLKEFIEAGHKRQITASSPGLSSTEVALRRLAAETKINLKIVPFGGSGPSIMAALGGQVDAYAGGGVYEYVRAGKMRVIVRFTEEARKPFQDVPSLKDLGYNISAIGFVGLFGPKGLPAQIHKKLEEGLTRGARDPSTTEVIDSLGETFFFRNSEDLGNYLREVYEQSGKEFKELGLGLYAKDKK